MRLRAVRAVLGEPRHYTTENTSDVTRVSLDLRVIPEVLFRSAHASPTGTVPFTLHRYYFTTATPWRRSVEQSGAAATASGSASMGAVDADDEAANAVSEPVISVGPHLEEGLAEAFEEQ